MTCAPSVRCAGHRLESLGGGREQSLPEIIDALSPGAHVVATTSMTAWYVSERARSRRSSESTLALLTGTTPLWLIRMIAASWAAVLDPAEASTTANTSYPAPLRSDSAGRVRHASVHRPAMSRRRRPVASTAAPRAPFCHALMSERSLISVSGTVRVLSGIKGPERSRTDKGLSARLHPLDRLRRRLVLRPTPGRDRGPRLGPAAPVAWIMGLNGGRVARLCLVHPVRLRKSVLSERGGT